MRSIIIIYFSHTCCKKISLPIKVFISKHVLPNFLNCKDLIIDLINVKPIIKILQLSNKPEQIKLKSFVQACAEIYLEANSIVFGYNNCVQYVNQIIKTDLNGVSSRSVFHKQSGEQRKLFPHSSCSLN